MSVNVRNYNNTSYGLNQPLINTPLLPIQANRAPTTEDFAPIGTIWIDKSGNAAFILIKILANIAIWEEIASSSTTIITDEVQTVDANPAILSVIGVEPSQATVWSGSIIAAPADFSANIGGTYSVSFNRGAVGNISGPLNFIDGTGNSIGGGSGIGIVSVNPDTGTLVVTGVAATVINWKTTYTLVTII